MPTPGPYDFRPTFRHPSRKSQKLTADASVYPKRIPCLFGKGPMKQNFGSFCFLLLHPFCQSFTKCSSQKSQHVGMIKTSRKKSFNPSAFNSATNPIVSPFFSAPKSHPKGIWNQLNEGGWEPQPTELSAAYHCSDRQVLRPARIATAVSMQGNIHIRKATPWHWNYP